MADEQYTNLDTMNISKLKVPDLKRELKTRGLNTSGNKMELVQRLTDALQGGKNDEGSHASADSVEDDLIDEDEVLNDDEIDEEVGNISNIDELEVTNKSFETTIETKPTKRKSFELHTNSTKDEKTAKKIVLNRNLSTEVQSETNETATETNGNTQEEKKVIKLSELSAKERLEMRAKKFGVPLSVDAKKEVRAQRFGVNSNKTPITLGNSGANVDLLKKRAERFGTVSTQLKKVETQEKMEKRKERFGVTTTTTTTSTTKSTPLKSNIKQPFRTMTSNLVKNVTTTIKATTRNNTKTTVANKPPIAVAKFNVVRSNTTIQQQQHQQQQQIDMKKTELLKNRSSSNGSIPLNSKPLERQGTFTKDNTTKKTSTNSKIAESKIPTQKFRSSAIQNRTVSSTTTSKITNRSPSTDRSNSSDFGFRNRRSPNTQIHQSNSTQSLQNGTNSTNCTNDLTVKRSSNPDITDATPKRKPVASRIASLWKKSHSDVGVSMGAKKPTNKINSTGAANAAPGPVKMRLKKTTTNSNSGNCDDDGHSTKRISRLGSFIKVDEISVT